MELFNLNQKPNQIFQKSENYNSGTLCDNMNQSIELRIFFAEQRRSTAQQILYHQYRRFNRTTRYNSNKLQSNK